MPAIVAAALARDPAIDRDALILAHLPLAQKLAALAINRGGIRQLEADEIRGDAIVGLVKAGRSYGSGTVNTASFATYARYVINSAILDGQRKRGPLSRNAYASAVAQALAAGREVVLPVHVPLIDIFPSGILGAFDLASQAELAEDLQLAISRLNPKERYAISALMSGMAHREIASHFGLSIASSCQIRAGAMRKLRADPRIRRHWLDTLNLEAR